MNIQANPLLLLRLTVALILLMHSIPVMLNNGVNDFGNLYLDPKGFAPFGLALAWSIKLSHVAAAICFVINRYVKVAGLITIFILMMGIIMIHWADGWFVVGNGRNGIEFSVLLIAAILTIMFPKGYTKL